MSMENYLNEFIDELIQEVEQELDEATTTAGVDGYQTPFAFGAGRKKDKKKEKDVATQAGYTLAEGYTSNFFFAAALDAAHLPGSFGQLFSINRVTFLPNS